MALTWHILHFNDLTTKELYDAMALRQMVFILEQGPYLDADGKDLDAWHVFGREQDGQLVAYSRLLAPGMAYTGASSIGRVITHASVRRMGYGKELMEVGIAAMFRIFPDVPITISAQFYLLKFYKSFGFIPVGEVYDEDGIPHIKMTLSTP